MEDNEKIEQATFMLLQELKKEIEKRDTQDMKYSRVSELLAIVYEPVRHLAMKEKGSSRKTKS